MFKDNKDTTCRLGKVRKDYILLELTIEFRLKLFTLVILSDGLFFFSKNIKPAKDFLLISDDILVQALVNYAKILLSCKAQQSISQGKGMTSARQK